MWHRRTMRSGGLMVCMAMAAWTGLPAMTAEAQAERRVAFDGGTDLYNKYFFRGALEEDRGLILQPWGELTFNLYEAETALTSLDLTAGTWNSIHSEQTGATGNGPSTWYESDFYASVGANLFDDVDLDLTYTAYTSPNGAFATVEEFALGVGYDDSTLWDDQFALNPHVLLAKEVAGGRNAYLELGLAPGFELDADGHAIEIGFPVIVGMSLDDYYVTQAGDETFYGYTQAGVTATLPLAFVSPTYGHWELSAGTHYLHLGQATRETNDGDNHDFIASLGLSVGF